MSSLTSLVSTPRRSPRLAAIRSNQSKIVSQRVTTPVRDSIRKFTGKNAAILEETKSFIERDSRYSSLHVQLFKAEVTVNKLNPFLVAVRSVRSYDCKIGPYDAMKLIVKEDGTFSLLVYDKTIEDGTVKTPVSSSQIVPVLEILADQSKVVCSGVPNYSAFKASIGYDVHRAVPIHCPPDSVRDIDCPVIFEGNSSAKRKSSFECKKCSSLKWQLSKRKREHDELTSSQRSERQSSSSKVPFHVLSPQSKKARFDNMSATIHNLQSKVDYFSKKIDHLSVNDSQNNEIGQLVTSISDSPDGRSKLHEIFSEADRVQHGLGGIVRKFWEDDVSDWNQFLENQKNNVTGKRSNKWSPVTIRLALSIFSRSPAAYHVLKDLGILQLPCDRTLKSYMHKYSSNPGICQEALLERSHKYEAFKKERVENGFPLPIGEGVLIWDEVKVQSRIIWNSSNSSIIGYSMSSDDFISLHDVYEVLQVDEKCQKTAYVMQFLWRDLSSDFDVVGPYFNSSSTLEVASTHAIVVRTMLAFTQFGFHVRALLCDGASSNCSLLKLFCGYANNEEMDISQPSFVSPFDGKRVHLLVCPSHQLKNMIAALYSSRTDGTKEFSKDGIMFGWSSIEEVYKSDLLRAKAGISRRVPGLKFSHVVRDSWTRLNVLPAKIMQQPYMIAAVKEMADKSGKPHMMTAEYLEACHFIFETGILSHDQITSSNSQCLLNISEGMRWFFKWKEELQKNPDIKFRSPVQTAFLAWQTWDLLLIMYYGFKGLCEDFLEDHKGYYIAPIRINGSAIESIFSSLKYISGGNLSATNYGTSLSSLVTQRTTQKNPHSEKEYRTDIKNIN